jgi:hypothetical protein
MEACRSDQERFHQPYVYRFGAGDGCAP